MDDNVSRVLNAAAAGQQVMNDNSSVWNGKPAVVSKKTALDAKIAEIELLEDGITGGNGNATAKTLARVHAAQAAVRLSKPMTVFARDTNDAVLEGEIDLSWSKLRYSKDQVVIDNWQLVHDRAESNEAALVAGGYSEAVWISELDGAITAFKLERGKPMAKRADIKALNEQVALKTKELQLIKADLVGLLAQWMVSDAAFYRTVVSAFELDMSGRRHVALRLHFIDELTGVRLPGVEALVVELGRRATASKNGRIDLSRQQLPQGNYRLVFALKGYTEQTVDNVGIDHLKMKLMEVVMVKNS